MEEFRPIPGFPNYQVSNLGRVLSTKGGKERFLRPQRRNRYLSVNLALGPIQLENGIEERFSYKFIPIHTLVLMVFRGPRPHGYQACHNDGNRLNNELSNLRWDTAKNNCADRVIHDTAAHGERNPFSKLKDEDIPKIRQRLKAGDRQVDIAKDFNVSQARISKIRLKQGWNHIGGTHANIGSN